MWNYSKASITSSVPLALPILGNIHFTANSCISADMLDIACSTRMRESRSPAFLCRVSFLIISPLNFILSII